MPGEVIFVVYRNRSDEIKPYEVRILGEKGKHTRVMDIRADMEKTFTRQNFVSRHDSFEDAAAAATEAQKNYTPKPREERQPRKKQAPERRRRRQISDGQFTREVCFTGFGKEEKEELIQLAKKNNLRVRAGVTANLGLLVCGGNAGPAKKKAAAEQGASLVAGADGFRHFLDTGEVDA